MQGYSDHRHDNSNQRRGSTLNGDRSKKEGAREQQQQPKSIIDRPRSAGGDSSSSRKSKSKSPHGSSRKLDGSSGSGGGNGAPHPPSKQTALPSSSSSSSPSSPRHSNGSRSGSGTALGAVVSESGLGTLVGFASTVDRSRGANDPAADSSNGKSKSPARRGSAITNGNGSGSISNSDSVGGGAVNGGPPAERERDRPRPYPRLGLGQGLLARSKYKKGDAKTGSVGGGGSGDVLPGRGNTGASAVLLPGGSGKSQSNKNVGESSGGIDFSASGSRSGTGDDGTAPVLGGRAKSSSAGDLLQERGTGPAADGGGRGGWKPRDGHRGSGSDFHRAAPSSSGGGNGSGGGSGSSSGRGVVRERDRPDSPRDRGR